MMSSSRLFKPISRKNLRLKATLEKHSFVDPVPSLPFRDGAQTPTQKSQNEMYEVYPEAGTQTGYTACCRNQPDIPSSADHDGTPMASYGSPQEHDLDMDMFTLPTELMVKLCIQSAAKANRENLELRREVDSLRGSVKRLEEKVVELISMNVKSNAAAVLTA
ncbi:hypothetical protein B0H16DRAFT_1570275 [Mycena metata]|uniref:Uncharacterized protein n=1 Tax=Mycena metata TaxID=1033252 RepID=A0AAD7IC78_9AGAR|nr:hypothetical protein B0H16DRAFT_1570275 [Mycena metata]